MNIKILCRLKSIKTANLKNILLKYGNVDIVEDIGETKKEYSNLCSSNLNPITSWDRSFYDIKSEKTVFIEDDVAGNQETFDNLFKIVESNDSELFSSYINKKNQSSNWFWWQQYENDDSLKNLTLYQSYNPFCVLNGNLIDKVLSFRDKNKKFIFHEILFASLASTKFDFHKFNKEIDMKWYHHYSGIAYKNSRENKLHHPIKKDDLHSFICLNSLTGSNF